MPALDAPADVPTYLPPAPDGGNGPEAVGSVVVSRDGFAPDALRLP